MVVPVKLAETVTWEEDLLELQNGWPPSGGPVNLAEDDGVLNAAPRQLGARTRFLRAALEAAPAVEGLAVAAGAFILSGTGDLLRNDTTGAITPTGVSLADLVADGFTDAELRMPLADRGAQFLQLSSAGQPDQSMPSGVITKVTNMVAAGGNLGALWDGSRFTATAATAGLYMASARLNMNSDAGEAHYIQRNGASIWDVRINPSAGNSNITSIGGVLVDLAPGDFIEFAMQNLDDTAKDAPNNLAHLLRLGPTAI